MLEEDSKKAAFIKGVIFSYFGEEGPAPKYHHPDIDLRTRHLVGLKSLSLLAGEVTGGYQRPKLASIIPFPHLKISCVVFLFEIPDPDARASRVDASISILFQDSYSPVIYKTIEELTKKMEELSVKLTRFHKKDEESQAEVDDFYNKIVKYYSEYKEIEYKRYDLFMKEHEVPITWKLKIAVVGDPEVGKTTLMLRYVDLAFRELYVPTIGVQVSTKTLFLEKELSLNKIGVQLNLWDIAGHDKFSDIRKSYYEGAEGIVFVYDTTRPETLKSLNEWIADFEKIIQKPVLEIPGVIIGNKVDLKDQRKVKNTEGLALAKKFDLNYCETSALTGQNVNEVFEILARSIIKE
ncbi:MAG: GTP-binding protein [Candidatus Lokiarchaeota archaeon]|nr:GTP-binding protein [Candidatus Lokiarchaeota archaeon]